MRLTSFVTTFLFSKKTKLENLSHQFNINITYSPKFHCELNAIKGLWCNMKGFVHQRSDQQYSTMLSLIEQPSDHFVEIRLYKNLFRRFWNECSSYQQGQSYENVLKLFFSNSWNTWITSHRKIVNMKLENYPNWFIMIMFYQLLLLLQNLLV